MAGKEPSHIWLVQASNLSECRMATASWLFIDELLARRIAAELSQELRWSNVAVIGPLGINLNTPPNLVPAPSWDAKTANWVDMNGKKFGCKRVA
jgi:hypothetical protein